MSRENVLQVMIGDAELLVRSSDVRQIVRPTGLTRVPMGPSHLLGLANIQGQIVSVIDLGGITRLSHCKQEQSARTRFLLLKHPSMHVALWVDSVRGLHPLPQNMPIPDSETDAVGSIEIGGMACNILYASSLLA